MNKEAKKPRIFKNELNPKRRGGLFVVLMKTFLSFFIVPFYCYGWTFFIFRAVWFLSEINRYELGLAERQR